MSDSFSEKEVKKYLDDLDNLIDTGHFSKDDISEYTFREEKISLTEFIKEGREIIRQSLMKSGA